MSDLKCWNSQCRKCSKLSDSYGQSLCKYVQHCRSCRDRGVFPFDLLVLVWCWVLCCQSGPLVFCCHSYCYCCLWCWWLILLLSLVLCILPNWLHRLCCLVNLVSCHWLVLCILLRLRLMLCRSVVFSLLDARTPKYDHLCVKHPFLKFERQLYIFMHKDTSYVVENEYCL